MRARDDSPQIGMVDVEDGALDAPGVVLDDLVADLGSALAAVPSENVPTEGWRVLSRHTSGSAMIGAPLDADGTRWRIAHVPNPDQGKTHVHPDPERLRASRSVRRRGLELRWPDSVRAGGDDVTYAIDIVNAGDTRWTPDDDGFLVVGAFVQPGESGFNFGWMASGQHAAVALDPGEYARVPVVINGRVWSDLEPGKHDLRAVLVSLGLSAEPLAVDVTPEQIARNKPVHSRATRSADEQRQAMEERIAALRARIAAAGALPAVVTAVEAASTSEDAVANIRRLLGVSAAAAEQIWHTPLQQLHHSERARIERDIENHLRLRRSGDGETASKGW
ncbi:MAG: hypothetical protein ACQEW8_13140 [Actinomycetota bacterium]